MGSGYENIQTVLNLKTARDIISIINMIRGVFDGTSGAAAAALFVGAQTPSGHK